MKQLSFVVILFAFVTCGSYAGYHKPHPEKRSIKLQIFLDKDTFALSEPIICVARITNLSKKEILLPKTFSVSSNLFPNGTQKGITGGSFYIQFQPTYKWMQILIENDVYGLPNSFLKIAPKDSIDFNIDISEHLKEYNNEWKTAPLKPSQKDSLVIDGGKRYKMRITYENGWLPEITKPKHLLQTEPAEASFFLIKDSVVQ